MDLANDLVEAGGYLVGMVPANVARDCKTLANQPLALGFAPLNDLITIHCLHRRDVRSAFTSARADPLPELRQELFDLTTSTDG
jgi:hypothetical protein